MVVVYILARPVAKLNNEVAVLLALVALPMACFSSVILGIGEVNPSPWFTPTDSDVVGRWELDDETRDYLTYYEIAVLPHELVIEPGGTFYMANIPVALYTEEFFKYTSSAMTGTGTWEITAEPNVTPERTVLLLTLTEVNTDFPLGPEETFILYFQGHLPPYTLRMVHSAFSTNSFNRESYAERQWFGD